MRFSYRFELPVPADDVWRNLLEPERIAGCMPGLEDLEALGAGRYAARLVAALGPIRLGFRGNASVAYHAVERRVSADVTMRDGRTGSVGGRFAVAVGETNPPARDASVLLLDSDVVIGGKLGEFAQPLLKRKADEVVREFVANLRARLEGPGGLAASAAARGLEEDDERLG